MKNRITKIITACLLIGLVACDVDKLTSLKDDFRISVSTTAVESKTSIQIENAVETGTVPEDLSISFSGELADKVYTSAGKKEFKIDEGIIDIGILKEANATTENPITVYANITGTGFLDKVIPITFDGEAQGYHVSLLEKTNLPDGISIEEFSIPSDGSGKIPAGGVVIEQTSSLEASTDLELDFDEGTTFLDDDGNTITGDFDLEVEDYDMSNSEYLDLFPNGLYAEIGNESPSLEGSSAKIGSIERPSAIEEESPDFHYVYPLTVKKMRIKKRGNLRAVKKTGKPFRMNFVLNKWRSGNYPYSSIEKRSFEAGDSISVFVLENVDYLPYPKLKFLEKVKIIENKKGRLVARYLSATDVGTYVLAEAISCDKLSLYEDVRFRSFPVGSYKYTYNNGTTWVSGSFISNGRGGRSEYFIIRNELFEKSKLKMEYSGFGSGYSEIEFSVNRRSYEPLIKKEDGSESVSCVEGYSNNISISPSSLPCRNKEFIPSGITCDNTTYVLDNQQIYMSVGNSPKKYSYTHIQVSNNRVFVNAPCLEEDKDYTFYFNYDGKTRKTNPIKGGAIEKIYDEIDKETICSEIETNRN